jgi:hypothetical protein
MDVESLSLRILCLLKDELNTFLENILGSAYGKNWKARACRLGNMETNIQLNEMDLLKLLTIFETNFDVIKFDLSPLFPMELLNGIRRYRYKIINKIIIRPQEAYEDSNFISQFMTQIQASNKEIEKLREQFKSLYWH